MKSYNEFIIADLISEAQINIPKDAPKSKIVSFKRIIQKFRQKTGRNISQAEFDKLLHQYVEWVANRRIKALGLKPIYDIPAKNNPLPWTEHWISSKGLQVAPQETEVESYIVGGIKQDVTKDSFSGFKL